MIRPFTLICLATACGSGLYLYQCKHQAQELDREIGRTIRQTEETRSRIGMLKAEWAQLNEPQRVAELARAHTTLQPAKPEQFTTVAQLPGRLPAAVAPAPERPVADRPVAETTTPAAPSSLLPAIVGTAQAEPLHPAKPAEPPRAVAAAAPPPTTAPTVAPAAAPASTTVATVAPVVPPAAETRPAPRPVVRPAEPPRQAPRREPVAVAARTAPAGAGGSGATAPGTVGAAVLRAMQARGEPTREEASAAPMVAPARVEPRPMPTYAPAYTPAYVAPAASSVLGGRSALPPPVPFAER